MVQDRIHCVILSILFVVDHQTKRVWNKGINAKYSINLVSLIRLTPNICKYRRHNNVPAHVAFILSLETGIQGANEDRDQVTD